MRNALYIAQEQGFFKQEITPVTVKSRKGPEEFAVDEHARPQATLDGLKKLPPVFKKDGMVTAGNASGICDGAAAVVVASEDALKKHQIKPVCAVAL